MATCISVKLSPDDETSQHDANGIQRIGVYKVEFNSISTSLEALVATDGTTSVPAYLDPLVPDPTGVGLKVINKQPRRLSPTAWAVYVTWAVPRFDETRSDGGKWSKRVSVRGIQNVEPGNRDITGKPVVNSYGDIFETGIPRIWYDEEITIGFLTDTVDGDELASFRGSINSPEVSLSFTTSAGLTYARTFPEYTLKFIDAPYEIELASDGKPAWRVSLVLSYRSNIDAATNLEYGWRTLIEDKGHRWFGPATDESNIWMESSAEVYLDGHGGQLDTTTGGALTNLIPVQTAYLADFSTIFAGL